MINTNVLRRQATTVRPLAKSLDGFTGRDRHWHHVLGGLDQWCIEQCCQTATRLDLCTGPLVIDRSHLIGIKTVELDVQRPDLILLLAIRQIQEEHRVKPFGTYELRWQLLDVVRGTLCDLQQLITSGQIMLTVTNSFSSSAGN